MHVVANEAESARVTGDAERAKAIRERMDRLGISAHEFERRTGVDRKAVGRAARGDSVRGSTYTAVETWLTKLEQENGEGVTLRRAEDAPAIRLTFHDVYGIGEIIAEGPPEERDALVEAVSKLLRDIRER